jgi:Tfp pilus assembly protein PilF
MTIYKKTNSLKQVSIKVKQKRNLNKTTDDIKSKIITGFNTKKLTEANTWLNELRKFHADSPFLLASSLSEIAQEITPIDMKLALFEEAHKFNPDDPSILNRYGYALTKFKPEQREKAFEMFEHALEIEPNNVKTCYKYGLALAKYEQVEKAGKMFERALKLESNNCKVLNSYAIALSHQGLTKKAFKMFERSLQVNANDTIALTSYGKALVDNGDYAKAFEMFERSLQVNANDII